MDPADHAVRHVGRGRRRARSSACAASTSPTASTGIVALGTTGESPALDADEKRAVIDACSRVCVARGAPLIVGTGTNDTRVDDRRDRRRSKAFPAVVGALVVVPYYIRPSEAAIVEHYRVVAEASPVPIVAYNIPFRTGRGLGAAALLELAAIPNVAGVKQAVGALDADTLEVLADAPAGFAVLGGDDAIAFPIGVHGRRRRDHRLGAPVHRRASSP